MRQKKVFKALDGKINFNIELLDKKNDTYLAWIK